MPIPFGWRNGSQRNSSTQPKCGALCPYEGGGIQEAILNREGPYFYLFHDGWTSLDVPDYHLRARSLDLIGWEKQGAQLTGARKARPDEPPAALTITAGYPPSFSRNTASLPYSISAQAGRCLTASPRSYATLLAHSASIEGPW